MLLRLFGNTLHVPSAWCWPVYLFTCLSMRVGSHSVIAAALIPAVCDVSGCWACFGILFVGCLFRLVPGPAGCRPAIAGRPKHVA
jgi:hypothetical protein